MMFSRFSTILMAAAETNGGAAAATPKAPTILAKLHKEWQDKGGKRPDAKALAALKAELGKVDDEFKAAAAALEAAREKRSAVSLKIIRACGTKGTLKLDDGRLFEATARGDVVFFRTTSGETY